MTENRGAAYGFLPLTVLLALCPALFAAPADPVPVGASLRARFDEKGVWRLESDQGVFFVRCGLRLWTKAGFVHQASARAVEEPGDGPAGRTFHGVLRVRSRIIHYWQTATPTPTGLLVQYAAYAPDWAEGDELAAGFDLPVSTFGGASCTPAGGKALVLPKAKPAQPRLVERDLAGVVLRRNGVTLAIGRRPTGKIIVQDGREWKDPYFHVLLYATQAAGDPPGVRSVTFHLNAGPAPAAPVIAAVVPGAGSVPCHGVHETEVHFWAPCEQPFRGDVRVWAKVATPTGRRYTARGFYTRDFEVVREGEAERLRPVGHGRWRLRITPTEPGVHHYLLKVATAAGEVMARPMAFSAVPSPTQQFLRPPTRQTRYLENSAGRAVFLIGHNYCWPATKTPARELDAAIDKMAGSGVNATRLWLCSWGLGIEGTRPDAYRMGDAWLLDRVLRRARERGVYVQLCLDNFTDLAAEAKAAANPYLARNGGPCARAADFFSLPAARAQHQRRLDYLTARYAAFTSLLAWELCNEMDYATADRRDPALLAWARAAAARLKKQDPYGHPVTASLGIGSRWAELWESPEIDLVQTHAYIHRPVYVRDRTELDAAALVLRQADEHAACRKPHVVAEFGFLGTTDFNPLNDADRTGIHLHNAIWASALGGCAGTAMSWWWEGYLPRNDLYYHYVALERFLRGESLPNADWRPIRDKGGDVRVLGLKGRDAAFLWVQHRDNRWYRRLVEERKAALLAATTIPLSGLDPGRYRVEWWDTYAGQPITHTLAGTADGSLTLRVPAGHPDIACKLTRIGD